MAFSIGFLLSLKGQDASDFGKPDLYGPEFQKRFIASYGVLEAREPELQELEISLLEKIGPMVEENPEFAKSMLEGMLGEETPASATFNFILANLYFNGDALEDAMNEYGQAIAKFPTFRRAWKNLGLLRMRQADYAGGLEALSRCIELGDTSPDTYGSVGYCHLQVGNVMAAELAYNAAIVLDPNNVEWLEGKGQAMIQARRYQEALPILRELIARNPQRGVYRMLEANVHVEASDFNKAAQTFEIIHALGEGNGGTRLQLANIYSSSGRYALSVDTLLEATDEEVRGLLGQVLLNVRFLLDNDEVAQAQRLFGKIGAMDAFWDSPDRTRYLLLEAAFADRDGDLARQERKLQEALENDPLSGEALVGLGSLLANRGENAKALYYFERAYQSDDYAYEGLVMASETLIGEQRFTSALNLLERALALQPSEDLRRLIAQVRAAEAQ